jgi:phosphoglycolate phosphatase-like HAD superfamily hydrolase
MMMPQSRNPAPSPALVLFDIDGTLIRKAGPHHREALVEAVRRITGLETTTDGVPVAGMLDRDILTNMLLNAGATRALVRRSMPELIHTAQSVYARCCPNLERKVCPGVRLLLARIARRGIPAGLVTGNLSRIAWKKMDRAKLRPYFRFGAFAENASTRAGLVTIAIRRARREGWIDASSRVTLIGDHPNDVHAARVSGVRCVAVATGVVPASELAAHSPDLLLSDLRSLSLDMLL